MSPPERKKPAWGGRPFPDNESDAESSGYPRQVRARRAESRRLPVQDHSGRSDPCWYEPPGESGYEPAALHLLDHGLLPAPNRGALRAMWRSGGESRRIAEVIAQRWWGSAA